MVSWRKITDGNVSRERFHRLNSGQHRQMCESKSKRCVVIFVENFVRFQSVTRRSNFNKNVVELQWIVLIVDFLNVHNVREKFVVRRFCSTWKIRFDFLSGSTDTTESNVMRMKIGSLITILMILMFNYRIIFELPEWFVQMINVNRFSNSNENEWRRKTLRRMFLVVLAVVNISLVQRVKLNFVEFVRRCSTIRKTER